MSQRIKRLAVAIGNSEYQNLAKLANAAKDAEAVQKMLQSLKFEVTYGTSLSRDEILKCFSNILDSWEYQAKEIVFYYSGRAISSDDKVYLAPYDAGIDLPETLIKSYLDVDIIINSLLGKRKNYTVPIIIILNCYRSLFKSGGINDYYQGLPLRKVSKEIGKNSNIAIWYSMTEDEVTLDGNAENELSSFARILLENMEKDITINRIHSAILTFAKNSDTLRDKYVSWIYQSLFEPYKFCLPESITVMPYDLVKDPFYGIPPANQNFVDRSRIFTKLDAVFAERSSGRRVLVLQGLGGVGKTQIMLRYCYFHRLEYNFIFWLEIEGKITARESFHKLAINLGIDVESANEKSADDSIIKWVSAWLENKTKWLLLLNNADEEMTKDIFNLLPRFGGNIIITTREPIPLTKAKIVHVSKMEEGEALSLLYGAVPIDSINQQTVKYHYAKEIISELDSLPLAIDLARAYIDTMLLSYKDYLRMFRDQRNCADVFLYHDKDNIHQYNHSLSTVWKISFDRIKTESPVAALIFDACSFLNPEHIPIGFFERQYSILEYDIDLSSSSKESEDSWKIVRAAIAVLVKFSFAIPTLNEDKDEIECPASNTLTVHRLVQKVNYDEMSNEQKINWARKLATALQKETQYSDTYSSFTRAMMNAYLLHIRHFAEMLDINQKVLISKDLFKLIIQTTYYLLDNGVYFGTEKLARLTLSISASIHDPESNSMAISLLCLADVFYKQANYSEAEPLYERALAIREKVLGPEHSLTAESLDYLAHLYKSQGNYAKAVPLCERALTIIEKTLGHEHPGTKYSLNNLAVIYSAQRNHAKAEPLYKRALEISEKILGSEHSATATSLHNLAELYKNQGYYTKAKPLYERALVIFEKVFGPTHPSTATSLNNLAGLYKAQGNYGKAESLYERALAIREKALGLEHPSTATSLGNLAELYINQGYYAKAESLYERALAIFEKTLGPEHPDTAKFLNNLGEVYLKQGSYAKAEPLYERALVISEKALGPEHPSTAKFLNNLASLYKNQKNYAKVGPLYERALAIFEKTLGPEHPHTAASLNNLGWLYLKQGSHAKAETLYNRALVIKERALGSEHPETATSLNNLAGLYFNQRNYAKAEPLYERALAIREKALGPEHSLTAVSLNNLAMLYKNLGNNIKAEQLYERALAISEKVLGPTHQTTVTYLNNLAGLYKAQEFYGKAEALYKKYW